jgi:LPPG:FO 2-phospho-L-lactate transferase
VKTVVLAGGTGGAKLAAGLQDVLGEDVTVIANTGDDVEALGVYVSPDPDLITYWLTGQIDEERGWGIRGDVFTVFERLVRLGEPDWFRLGDLDLATCLRRRRLMDEGMRQTEAQREISSALGARGCVLAMCDEPVRTQIRTAGGWMGVQEYLVRERAGPAIEEIAFDGAEGALMTGEVADALAGAGTIVIGPSNPVISIGPILAVPGIREAIATSSAPVVAVSPFVDGKVVKGPTAECLRAVGATPDAEGVAGHYEGVIGGMVVDSGDPGPPSIGIPTVYVPTRMDSPSARRRLGERTLEFASELA